MQKLIEIGLSGWIVSGISNLFFGGAALCCHLTRRKTWQSRITAGGDVAGGDITKGENIVQTDCESSVKVSHCIQNNITAKGDVAGGDITKSDK